MQTPIKPGKHTFTIIEYGLIVGLVGFFVLAAFFLAKPGQRAAEARDAERQVAVERIAHALQVKKEFDRTPFLGRESAPAMMLATPLVQVIVTDDNGIVCNDPQNSPTCGDFQLDRSGANTRCVANFAALVPTYLEKMPIDPLGVEFSGGGLLLGAKNTGYYVRMLPGGQVEVGACNGEVYVESKVGR